MKRYLWKKNIIFDIGGVLLEYRWMDMLCLDYGMEKERAARLGSQLFNDRLWVEMDLGNISVADAAVEYRMKNPEFADDITWFFKNAELMRINRTGIWDRMDRLKKKGYMVYILSNYSKELLDIHTGNSYFWDYVDGEVVSYQVHDIKPNECIYTHLLQKYALEASECLFFDDRAENTAGAIKAGIDAITVVSEAQLADEIDKLIANKKGNIF